MDKIFLHLLLSTLLLQYVDMREFRVMLYPGRPDTVLTYPYSNVSECIYDAVDDITKCMFVRPFKEVKDAWRYSADAIKYISVSCQAQENYYKYRHVCICKDAKDAANPRKSQQHDVHHYCQITKLTNGMFSKLTNLEALDLSENLITNIQGDALDALASLRYLNLSHNPLSYLSGGFLCDAINLEILIIENTHLTGFPLHIFDCPKNLTNLKYIDMSQNIMNSLTFKTFKYIPNVQTLNLSSNNFSSFPVNAFIGGSELIALDLSENTLSTFPDGLCQSLPKLQYLFLSENRLKHFNVSVLSECTNMRHIHLSVNIISEVTGSVTAPSNIETLVLRRNSIRTVPGNAFLRNARNLTMLDLSMNIINMVEQNAFVGLTNLITLDLSDNLLNESTNLDNIMRPFENLNTLDLSVNQFRVVRSGSFLGLSRLKKLNMSRNKIATLEEKAWDGLSSLHILDLRVNAIKTLHPNVLSGLKSLLLIDLSFNELLSLDGVKIPASLITMELVNNKLEHFPTSVVSSNVQNINMHRNEIQQLSNTTFINTSSLRHIDLSYNRLRGIDERSFVHATKLKFLNLSHNELMLNLSKDVFSNMISLETLDLSFNKIGYLKGMTSFSSLLNLEYFNLSNNAISAVNDLLPNEVKTNNTKLQFIDLSNCGIEVINHETFDGFGNLKNINLSNNRVRTFEPFQTQSRGEFDFTNNPLQCDCSMKWLINKPSTLGYYTLPKCVVYPANETRNIHSLVLGDLLCIQSEGCSPHCRCYSREPMGDIIATECSSGLEKIPIDISTTTITLHLAGNNFTTLQFNSSNAPNFKTEVLYLNNSQIKYVESNFFSHFTMLKKLYLDKNDLLNVRPNTFSPLLLLEELYLQHNRLVEIRADVIQQLKSLKILDLRNNDIWYMPREVLNELDSMSSLKRVYLGNNSWKCSCKNLDFRQWIAEKGYLLYDRGDIKCGSRTLRFVDEKKFVCYTASSTESQVDKKKLIIILVVVIVIFALLLTAVLYYRRDILAALYAKFKWGCFRPKYSESKIYDVFLVYDGNDTRSSEWVRSDLLPRLQRNNAYKVIIPDQSKIRDGDQDMEIDKIYDCKCCVFILSKYVTSNQYCSDCFQKIITFAKTNKEYNIILLVQGDIDMSILDPDMRRLLSSGNYITVRSRSVWDRLYYELPNPRDISEPFGGDETVSETDVIIYQATNNE